MSNQINIKLDLGHQFKNYDVFFNYCIIKCQKCNLFLLFNPGFDKTKYRVARYGPNKNWLYYPTMEILSCAEVIIKNIIE